MFREWIHALVWSRRHRRGKLEVPELSFILGLLEPRDVAADVGAHAGSWTIPLSRHLAQGHVFAFEALPYYAAVLRRLMRLQNARNVTVINCAVTERPQTVRMVAKDPAGHRLTGMTHIAGANEAAADTVEVPGQPLDEFFADKEDRVRLLKCDVEGAEYGVLAGAAELLKRCRPLIFAELVPGYLQRYGHTVEEVFELLAPLDYQGWILVNGNRPERIASPANYSGHDVLFAPRGQQFK